ncbi:heme NO-binding protein, partial [Paraburkholderia sp. Ac-20342]|nr:heme NO-binding protein [Paraburkholderia sp. Ac-20342]
MKGIVFNLLEELVRREHGEDAWDDLLDAAHVQGAYTS